MDEVASPKLLRRYEFIENDHQFTLLSINKSVDLTEEFIAIEVGELDLSWRSSVYIRNDSYRGRPLHLSYLPLFGSIL